MILSNIAQDVGTVGLLDLLMANHFCTEFVQLKLKALQEIGYAGAWRSLASRFHWLQ